MSGYRRHGRTLVKCPVKLQHDGIGEIFAETRDMSETGVFVLSKDLPSQVSIGDGITANLNDNSSNDSVRASQLTVVRMTDDGLGLAYE